MTGFEPIKSSLDVPVLAYSVPAEDSFGVEFSTFALGDEKRFRAVTDRGTVIPLFRYEALITPSSVGPYRFDPDRDLPGFLSFLEKMFVKNIMNLTSWLERVAPINPAANCHGWTFAGGHFGVDDSYVPVILKEHGYSPVQEPKNGDIVIYHHENGRIGHSGFVRSSATNREIVIESKWGPFSVFTHPLQAHLGVWSFYRTNRAGHCLTIESIPS
jgi:hypothetical protein